MKFLLELASEEIPARMQAAAVEQLRTRFVDGCKAAGLSHGAVTADVTPRRLWLIAEDVAPASAATREERKGPAATAPEAAIAGFLRSTGLTRDALEERATPKGAVLFAHIETPGRDAEAILAELVPAIVRGFQWPKSMRWGAASAHAGAPRWVRPLTGIVALLDGKVVACEAHGIAAGRVARGHRIHAPGEIDIASAETYLLQLRGARVIASSAERRAIIETNAATVALTHGLSVIPDVGLVAENAGLTEWPVPMIGSFDPAFLAVPREVIQLTMRTNQKYFACADASGALAPNFVCVANLDASDSGVAIVAGNERVLSARLSDAKFFWDQDVATVKAGGLEAFLPKLGDIVFHEDIGTLSDKIQRVGFLCRHACEKKHVPFEPGVVENAVKIGRSDLVSSTVGEFPELQGVVGRRLAEIVGLDPKVCRAISDFYKPLGPSDEVPDDSFSAFIGFMDKLDTISCFLWAGLTPTGSKDPYALRRSAIGIIRILEKHSFRINIHVFSFTALILLAVARRTDETMSVIDSVSESIEKLQLTSVPDVRVDIERLVRLGEANLAFTKPAVEKASEVAAEVFAFLAERMKIQQREAGVRQDVFEAAYSLESSFDLVSLLARVRALHAFVSTDDGTNLLAGVKRAANMLRIEEAKGESFAPESDAALFTEAAETALGTALDAAVPAIAEAVAAEDFTAAMAALAGLRPAVDAFFDGVIVNAPDPKLRVNRLGLLARLRAAAYSVADFSKVEG